MPLEGTDGTGEWAPDNTQDRSSGVQEALVVDPEPEQDEMAGHGNVPDELDEAVCKSGPSMVDVSSIVAAFGQLAAAASEVAASGEQPDEWTPERRRLVREIVMDALDTAVPDPAGAGTGRLRDFTDKSFADINQVPAGIIEKAVKELTRDPDFWEKLRDLVNQAVEAAVEQPGAVNQVTDEIAASRGLDRADAELCLFVLACFVVLTAGVVTPLVVPAGEVIFANTVATTTLVVTAAAMLKDRPDAGR